MELEKYLSLKNISVIQFAKLIKKTRGTVYSYLNKEKFPKPETQNLIFEVTRGEVTPNDFVLDQSLTNSKHFIYNNKPEKENE